MSKEREFKDELLKRLDDHVKITSALKDNTEMVILKDGKRVSVKGKTVWPTEKGAQNAIMNIVRSSDWRLKFFYIRRYLGHVIYAFGSPGDGKEEKIWADKALKIRQKWIKDHLRVIPLKDYIIMESKRSKA